MRSSEIGDIGSISFPVSGSRFLALPGSRPSSPPRLPLEPLKTISYKLIDPFTGDTTFTCKWDCKDGLFANSFAVNHAGTMLATLGGRCPLRLWDMTSGKCLSTIKDAPAEGFSLFFSPDDKILFVQSGFPRGPGLLLYAVPSGKMLAELKQPVGLSLVPSPDGRLLAEPNGRYIKLWSIPDEWRQKDK